MKQTLYTHQKTWAFVRAVMLLGIILTMYGLYIDFRVSFLRGLSVREIFWMILMPAVVLTMYFAPMLWRNSCPLATVSLWRYLLFGRRRLSEIGIKANELTGLHGKLYQLIRKRGLLISALLFWAIVPYRLIIFNADSQSLFWLLIWVFGGAFIFGALFPVKSGWCTSICPVAAAEKIYGMNPAFAVKNNRCHFFDKTQGKVMSCSGCSFNCGDVIDPENAYWQQALEKVFHNVLNAEVRKIFLATLPGFMAMFFLLANKVIMLPKAPLMTKVGALYGYMALGMLVSWVGYLILKKLAWQGIVRETVVSQEREVAYAIAKRRIELFIMTFSLNIIVFATTYSWAYVLYPKFFGSDIVAQGVLWTVVYFIFFFISFFGLRAGWNEKPGLGNYRPSWW